MKIWQEGIQLKELAQHKGMKKSKIHYECVYSIVFTWYSYQSVWTPTISVLSNNTSRLKVHCESCQNLLLLHHIILCWIRFIVGCGCQWSWTDFILLDSTVKVLSINGYSRQICETSPWGLMKKARISFTVCSCAASPILPNFPFPWSHRPVAFFRFFPSTVYFCDFYIALRAANKISQHLC